MGAADVIPPVVAAWFANVAFLLAGLILFWRVKT
jgi:lipopolysaccharide export LptBFGC system permease protein LptF